MKTAVVVDGTADLSRQTAGALGIEVIPMLIHFGSESFKDEIDISREDFYERLTVTGSNAQTAAPGPGAFMEVYDRMADEGAQAILSLHLASSLSATYSVAASAATGFSRVKVTAIDTGQLSLGLGFLADRAARELEAGNSLERVTDILREQMERTFVFAALDTMQYLRRSGRVTSLVAGLGSALRIKPILKLHGGLATTERVRTGSRAIRRLIDILTELTPLERVAIVHANAPERAEELKRLSEGLLPTRHVIVTNITPAIGAHVGPGTVGFVAIAEDPEKANAARPLFE
jgi:DegV family protein with EDD domain